MYNGEPNPSDNGCFWIWKTLNDLSLKYGFGINPKDCRIRQGRLLAQNTVWLPMFVFWHAYFQPSKGRTRRDIDLKYTMTYDASGRIRLMSNKGVWLPF